MTQGRIRGRALTAVLLLFTFLVLVISGIVLYIVPRGRVANLLDWHLLLLTKQDWGNVHIVFGALFLIAGVIHIWLNRKPLINYVHDRFGDRRRRPLPGGVKWELIAAAIVSAVLLVSAIEQVPPASYLMDLHLSIKNLWDREVPPNLRPGRGWGK